MSIGIRVRSSADTKPSAVLRNLLRGDEAIILPGVYNAVMARLVEQVGFSALYVTGAGIANTLLGLPDIGLITMSEMANMVRHIANATSLPVIADMDTGYGNAINVVRAVNEFESAGVAGVQLEDQITPKRCGHFSGKEVVDAEEMVRKIKIFCKSRQDPDLVLIARTDARAVHGLDEAIRRAKKYLDAGADVLFIEAPTSVQELEQIARELPNTPLMANMVEGGITPLLSKEELSEIGYRLVVYANMVLRASLFGARRALQHLAEKGSSLEILDSLVSWDERQGLVRLREFEDLEAQYLKLSGDGYQSEAP